MSWNAAIHVTDATTEIVVTDRELNEILRARLPRPRHPRALVWLLEALGLWSGQAIRGAVSADSPAADFSDEDFFGLGLWPESSLLVDLTVVLPDAWRDEIELREGAP